MSTKIEIFAAGRHRPVKGAPLSFSESDLAASAAAYDPALHEAPLVVGHPKMDAPAYGWVKSLGLAGDKLVATPHQIDPAFAELVNAGRFKRVSATFYPPDSTANPKPGVYYLKHVGFLGATPPAIKGLKSVSFAEDEDVVTIEFASPESWRMASAFRSLRRLLSGQRDALVAEKGVEAAELQLPTWDLDNLSTLAAELEAADAAAAAFAEPATGEDMPTPQDKAALDARTAELDRRQAALDARAAEFAEREGVRRRKDNAAFIDGLIAEGKLLPAERDPTLAFMESLDADQVVAFGEGEGRVERTRLDAYKAQLGQRPKLVEFGEHRPAAADGPGASDEEDADAFARRITEFCEAEAKAGRTVTVAAAAATLKRKDR